MNKEKILEIANRYTAPEEESLLLVEFDEHNVPTPTGETLNLMMWNFCEEELLAFAQSVIEEERDLTTIQAPMHYYKFNEDGEAIRSDFHFNEDSGVKND